MCRLPTQIQDFFSGGGSKPDGQKTVWTLFFGVFFSPQLILQCTEGVQCFITEKTTVPRIQIRENYSENRENYCSKDPDQAQQSVGPEQNVEPDLDPNCLTLMVHVLPERVFQKIDFEKNSADYNIVFIGYLHVPEGVQQCEHSESYGAQILSEHMHSRFNSIGVRTKFQDGYHDITDNHGFS